MDIWEFNQRVVGKSIMGVSPTDEGDEGFEMLLDSGDMIIVCFSGEEGDIRLNFDKVNTEEN